MKATFALLFSFLPMIRCCMPGFYGDPCLLCPSNHYCDGRDKYACPDLSSAWNGSRSCFRPREENVTVQLLPVRNWTGTLAPSTFNQSCGCYRMAQPLSVVLDVGRNAFVVGLVTRRAADGTWLRTFMVDYSADLLTWKSVGGLFTGNSEVDMGVQNLFPVVVQGRYFRVQAIDYFRWPGFRAAFLEARDYKETLLCPSRVNKVVVNATNCTYACKSGTYGKHCTSRARPTDRTPRHVSAQVQVSSSPLHTRLHLFGATFAVEFEGGWRGADLAYKVDDRPWMALSRQPFQPTVEQRALVGNDSAFLPLPYPVTVCVRLRVVWDNRLRDVLHSAWVTHGKAYFSVRNHSITWRWGLNAVGVGSSTLGDSAALLSITCNRSVVDARYGIYGDAGAAAGAKNLVPSAVFDVRSACGSNVSHGVVWLRENTELLGVDALLDDFVRSECGRGTTAWVLPRGPRRSLSYAKVQATCQLLI
jgi:hypothetical protein